jgi:7tm Chemosensory receptor
MAHVCILNELLVALDEKIVKLDNRSETTIERKLNFDYISTSTQLYDTIESYREAFGRIWSLHVSINRCFGFSILMITLNALVSTAFTLYFNILSHVKNITIDFIAQPSTHMMHIAVLFVFMIYTCEQSDAAVRKVYDRLNFCFMTCLRGFAGTAN